MQDNTTKTPPNYHELVLAVVKLIPKGRVTSYGAIANFLGLGASRMVGWALKSSSWFDKVPAHRVVNRKGELSGRNQFPTPTYMQEMLLREGIAVEDDRVVRFEELFWDPTLELGDDWDF